MVDGTRIHDLTARIGGDLKSLIQNDQQDRALQAIKGGTADFHIDEVTFLPVIPNPGKTSYVSG